MNESYKKSVSQSIYLSFCLSVYLPICQTAHFFVCLNVHHTGVITLSLSSDSISSSSSVPNFGVVVVVVMDNSVSTGNPPLCILRGVGGVIEFIDAADAAVDDIIRKGR